MTSLDVTYRRPEPQNGLPSTFCVLSTAVLGRFHYLHRAYPSKSWSASLSTVSLVPALRYRLRYSSPSSTDVLKPLSSYGQYIFRLANLAKF
ncbi:hypothetical protein DPMN_013988 [Dreissena polymorpha]|uniref:Uncharacterized protein n=1 Tax=Dreissena polymorpha TaxID=45954 RepID=A0A9D4S320_DREPO|nr:hypothetical protein DPMN_013988 [Dreissena polymorpha]